MSVHGGLEYLRHNGGAVAASSYSLVVVGSIYLLTSFGDETLFPER